MATGSEETYASREGRAYLATAQGISPKDDVETRGSTPPEQELPKLQTNRCKRIKLNVGGKVFTTTIETLNKDPGSMLASMFSGRFEMNPDEDGCYFIDRDSKHFRRILNYLRTGQVVLPEKQSSMAELLLEAEFYDIRPLCEALISTTIPSFGGSNLLSEQNKICLGEWLGKGQQEWKLIYTASQDGFQASDFHRCCDGKGETVSVLKSSEGFLFGGYTDVPWHNPSLGSWNYSTKSFLFSFKSFLTGGVPVKLTLNDGNNSRAVYHCNTNGLVFGYGPCIMFPADNSSKACKTTWNGGHTYHFPPGITDNQWLVGKYHFWVSDVEVFSLHSC